MAWVRKALLKSTVPGPAGPPGLARPEAVAADIATASFVSSVFSATFAALAAFFGRKRGLDPRDFGAVGDYAADDTAAIQACVTSAGIGGVILLPRGIFKITAPIVLLDGQEIRGAGVKATELRTATDIAILIAAGGQSQTIRKMLLRNTASGARTTYDIDFTSPTKPVITDVEISLPNESTGGGGVRFRKDVGVAGNSFMPQIARLWVRNGHLVIDGVTDGHVVDSYVWAPNTGARAAVDMSNIANGWSFSAVDVVPTAGDGAGYRLDRTWGTKINGGYIDGSYESILTGYGIRVIDSGQTFVAGTQFYNLGRSGIRLDNSHGCSFSTSGFERGNKQGNFYPDIDLYGSNNNTFTALGHSMRVARTNPGGVFREDAASSGNFYDASAINLDGGNNYAAPYFVGNAGTQGKNNRPASLWPRPSGVPTFLIPPASLATLASAAAWPAAGRVQWLRLHVPDGGVYRFMQLRVEVGSGTIQTALVRMNGLNYTRVMDSGIIACTTGMSAPDMSALYVAPGEYAFGIWVSNTTAQLRVATDEQLRTSRMCAESDLPGGIPATGTIAAWNSNRAVTGVTLTA